MDTYFKQWTRLESPRKKPTRRKKKRAKETKKQPRNGTCPVRGKTCPVRGWVTWEARRRSWRKSERKYIKHEPRPGGDLAPSGVSSTESYFWPEDLSIMEAPSGRVHAPDGMGKVGASPVRRNRSPVRGRFAGSIYLPEILSPWV